MVADMFEAQAKWLPDFAGKKLQRTASIAIPKDIVPAEVPVDPALAINSRFGKL
jgi:alpha-galactosidase